MNLLSAEVQILTHKLDRIRNHLERRLTVVDDVVGAELQYVLNMIAEFETVPAEWNLERPLVVRKESNNG